MRVPLEWLHEYCAPSLTAAQLADRLAMTGTEVERVEHHGVGAQERFVVGRVLEARAHPDADRLRVCTVDVGAPEPAQIVCGAPNVAAGQTVAVARPGAVMPDGTKLRQARLRGVDSDGMILAEDELAIGTEHDGIMTLDSGLHPARGPALDAAGLRPGAPLAKVLPVATDVLVLEITPNRPDCLGIYGVAREVHAATQAPIAAPPWATDPVAGDHELAQAHVIVECPELCRRFTARAFEDVTVGPSPPWLKARLMAAGQRPISNVVDITNYVMLMTAQPLHAFDLDRVAGGRLTVRRAREGETVTTLDGQRRDLDREMVLIEDADGPTSIAGVMGGERSEVGAGTTRVLIEAATWDGANIHRTSLRLGLRSDASTRFEKQLQPEQAMQAQAVATALMVELTGARVLPGTIDVGGPGQPPNTIHLRDDRIAGLLGAPVKRATSRRILQALEFTVADADGGLDVQPPAFRRDDVTREADVIEEVARIDGLQHLPATLPSRHGAHGRLTVRQRLRRRASDSLTAQGLHEIVGWSFASPEIARKLRLDNHRPVRLANPMSAEQSELRTMLLGSLLDAAQRNRARGAHAIRLFEAGAVYLPRADGALPDEPHHLAGVLLGPTRSPSWRDSPPGPADFFAVKGVVQGLLDTIRVSWSVAATQAPPFLAPGRTATVVVDGQPVGWVGELHPLVAAEWELADTVAAFELDLDAAGAAARTVIAYEDVTSFPEVREDLAVVVDDGVAAEQVTEVMMRTGAPLLARAQVFDVYRDAEKLGASKVSLAVRLSYRAPDRTLTDHEVAGKREAIIRALAQEVGGRVRDS